MKGMLLYYRQDACRNASYIQCYREEGAAMGMEIALFIVEDMCRDGSARSFAECISVETPPDFVINRTRNYQFGKILEDRGIPVFNCALVSRVGNDKWYAYNFFRRYLPELSMAQTRCIASDEELSDILFSEKYRKYRENFPVFKSRHGHGGQEVYLLSGGAETADDTCSTKAGCDAVTVYKALSGKPCIAQRRIAADIPTDVRVYVLGGKIYAAVKRTGRPEGFLANFSKGGHALAVSLTDSQRKLVEQVLDVLPIDYAGIDFIEDADGNWYLGEIEDMVGARMLWECQRKLPVGEYLRHIKCKVETGR